MQTGPLGVKDNDERNMTSLSVVLVLVVCTCMRILSQCSHYGKSAFGLMCTVHVRTCAHTMVLL